MLIHWNNLLLMSEIPLMIFENDCKTSSRVSFGFWMKFSAKSQDTFFNFMHFFYRMPRIAILRASENSIGSALVLFWSRNLELQFCQQKFLLHNLAMLKLRVSFMSSSASTLKNCCSSISKLNLREAVVSCSSDSKLRYSRNLSIKRILAASASFWIPGSPFWIKS